MLPDFSPAYNLRGRSHAILGRHKEALADFEKVMSLSPDLPDGYKNAGFVYLLQGDISRAKSHLHRGLALTPNDTKIRQALTELK